MNTESTRRSNSKERAGVVAIEDAATAVAPTAEERKRERKLKWKLDLYILPFLSLIYLLAQMVGKAPHLVSQCTLGPLGT